MRKLIFILPLLALLGLFTVRTCLLHRNGQSPSFPAMTPLIDEVHFNNTPLEAAFAELATKSRVRIDVDWAQLDQIGLYRTTPVTLRLFNLPPDTILRALLDQVPHVDPGEPDFTCGPDAYAVTTSAAMDRHVELRVYDVGEVAGRFGIPANQRLSTDSPEYEERLAGVVALIGPPTLDGAIDGDASMSEWRGRLFVRTTPVVHQAIERALRKLARMEHATPQLRPVIGPFPNLRDE